MSPSLRALFFGGSGGPADETDSVPVDDVVSVTDDIPSVFMDVGGEIVVVMDSAVAALNVMDVGDVAIADVETLGASVTKIKR